MINLYIGIFEVVLNFVLNYILVKNYGAIGAASATLIVAVCSSVVSLAYINHYFRKKKINEKGLNVGNE